jgi:hypothetical protein
MNELRISTGGDICLFVGGDELFGVTEFRAVSRTTQHEIREYLTAEPYETVNAGESHELTLSVLSLFDSGALDTDGFDLSVEDGDTRYTYGGCSVIRHEKEIRGGKNVVDVYTLRAERLTKRGINHAG